MKMLSLALTALMPWPIRAVAQRAPAAMMNHAPYWSPLENLIVFESDRDGDSEVYTIDPDYGTIRKLTNNRAADCAARWTRDGKFVLFQSDRLGTLRTFQMRADGSDQRALGHPPDNVESRSADGRVLLVVSTQGGRSVVFAVGADGTGVRQLTTGSHVSQPSLSPDGARIVYEELPASNAFREAGIVVMRRDGADARRLADGTDPSWSPDGDLILFKAPSTRPGGWGWEVATIHADGSHLTRLWPGVHPSWSADGSRIAFMAETSSERSDIWVMNRDGSNRRCLTCIH